MVIALLVVGCWGWVHVFMMGWVHDWFNFFLITKHFNLNWASI